MHHKTRTIIKLLEYFILGFIVTLGLVLAGLFICGNASCRNLIPSYEQFSQLVLIIFSVFSLLNTLRIWFNFNANDFNDESKDRFNLGLIGLTISYFLCGIFFNQISAVTNREISISGIYVFILFTIALTFTLILFHSDIWERSTEFVKVRLAVSLSHLIAILFNPFFGILLGTILLPYMILYKEKLDKSELK